MYRQGLKDVWQELSSMNLIIIKSWWENVTIQYFNCLFWISCSFNINQQSKRIIPRSPLLKGGWKIHRNVLLKTIKAIPAHRDLSTKESGVMLWKLFKTESTSKCRNALVLAFASQSRLYFILTLDMYILDLQVRCF